MESSTITVRPVKTIDEYHQVEAAQQQCWDMKGGHEVVPSHLLLTMQKNSGLVLGAFEEDHLVGFLFGFMGRTTEGRLKHCSHMMGVIPSHRGRGIGVALKKRQREFARSQGLDLVTWTYDPLERPNATLNLAKLGAVSRTYFRNVYGQLRDHLNRGLPTDRFQVNWWIDSAHVRDRLSTGRRARSQFPSDILNPVRFTGTGLPEPTGWVPSDSTTLAVEVPYSIQRIKDEDMDLAYEWRMLTRAIFEHYFDKGYSAVDFISRQETEKHRCYYVLEKNFQPR